MADLCDKANECTPPNSMARATMIVGRYNILYSKANRAFCITAVTCTEYTRQEAMKKQECIKSIQSTFSS